MQIMSLFTAPPLALQPLALQHGDKDSERTAEEGLAVVGLPLVPHRGIRPHSAGRVCASPKSRVAWLVFGWWPPGAPLGGPLGGRHPGRGPRSVQCKELYSGLPFVQLAFGMRALRCISSDMFLAFTGNILKV